MKQLLQAIIQLRNPSFSFDSEISLYTIIALSKAKAMALLRGLTLLAYGKNPKNIVLGKGVQFFNIPNIQWGKWVSLGDYSYLSGLGKGKLILGDNVSIGAFSRIVISTSFNCLGKYIHIHDHVGIGEYAYLGGAGGLEIGTGTIVGQYLSCHPENHIYQNPNQEIRFQGVSRKGIKIGKNCWIGAKVTILDGVTIGDNCVVAAGAVVTKSMPKNTVIGGIPAKVLKQTHLTNQSKIFS